ncbi:MAG: hypothetical protein PHP98_05425, partial [Kiritimatiellae bacterium]|nr:hypothetical protein [Kiritimatiellia bacterium]
MQETIALVFITSSSGLIYCQSGLSYDYKTTQTARHKQACRAAGVDAFPQMRCCYSIGTLRQPSLSVNSRAAKHQMT